MLRFIGGLIRFSLLALLLTALCLYLRTGIHTSVDEYVRQWSAGNLSSFILHDRLFQAIIGVALALAICRQLSLAWNTLFYLSFVIFTVEVFSLAHSVQWLIPGDLLRQLDINLFSDAAKLYPVGIFLIPLFCVLSSFCATRPTKILSTLAISLILWNLLTTLSVYILKKWESMDTPYLPEVQNLLSGSPWLIAAFLGVFFLMYSFLTAVFESFVSTTTKKEKEKTDPEQPRPIKTPPTPSLASHPAEQQPPLVMHTVPDGPSKVSQTKPNAKQSDECQAKTVEAPPEQPMANNESSDRPAIAPSNID